MASLAKRMAQVLRDYRKREIKQAQQRKESNRRYMTQKAQRIQNEKTNQLKQTTQKLKNSSQARAASGFAKGFASGLSFVPVTESKKESFGDPRIKQWAPEAYSELNKKVAKARAERDKAINKSKSGKAGNVVGNVAGTITGALLTSGATKAVAGKALASKTGKKIVGSTAEKLTQKALKDKAGKTLTRKLLERTAQNANRKITETALRNASKKVTGKIAENIAQDVAYDATFGAAKDVSRYVADGGDIRKNPADFAKYMAGNAAANTVMGAVGNVILPGAAALKKNNSMWTKAKFLGDVKTLKEAPQRVKSVRKATGEATDLLSPKLKSGVVQGAKGKVDNVTYGAVRNAMNDAQYVDELRRNGINGKSVRQVAAEEGRSVSDVIAEDYAKRRGVSLENLNKLRRNAADLGDDVTATGNKIAHRSGYEPSEVTAPEASSATNPDLVKTLKQKRAEKNATTQVSQANTPTAVKETPTTTTGTPTTAPTGDLDVTMGGTRSGAPSHKSDAAYTVSHAEGLSKEDTKEINDALRQTGANKTWSESHTEALEKVSKRVDEDGVEASAASLRRKFEDNERWDNESTAEAVLVGRRLSDMKRAAEQAGDLETAKRLGQQRDQVYAIAAIEGSETGKGLNAMKMFKAMTPEGRANSSLLIKARLEQQTGIKNLRLDEQLLDNLRNAKTENEIQDAQEKIAVALWDQIPPSLTEKLAAWRYLSMLGNPKTHIRNLVGNAIFAIPRTIKNTIATGIESVALKPGERTKAILNPLSSTDKKLLEAGNTDWSNVKNVFLNGSDKFESALRRAEGSRVFAIPSLEKLSKLNTLALNAEDEWFAKRVYRNAYASYLKANKISLADASQEMLDNARQYAWDEALTATYRESNILAEAINKVRKGATISLRDFRNAKDGQAMNRLALEKATGTLADALVPFAKTPANILKEGINYSPVSLVRFSGKLAKALSEGNMKLTADMINDFAQGVTGSGLIMLGMYMAKNGGITSSIESGYDTTKERLGTYNKDRGEQEYSFMVDGNKLNKFDLFNELNGKQYNVTGDSFVPAALPFFQGVELYNAIAGDDPDESSDSKAMKFGKALTNIAKLTDPVMNLSMLSSVQNAFDTWQSSGSGMSALGTFLQNSAQSRLGQYVPTVGGQVVNTARSAKPSASPTNTGMLGNWESFGRQQANKVPGLDRINADKSDAFGQKINKKENRSARTYALSALKNFISPMNIRTMRNTPADDEVQRLVTEGGQSPQGLLPETQKASNIRTKFGDKNLSVTQRDVADYNETHGQYALDHINKLIETKAYKKATDEEKVAMIKQVYRDATTYADEKLAKAKGLSDRDLLSSDSNYLKKEKKVTSLGIDKNDYAKVYKKVGKIGSKLANRNISGDSGPAYVAKTLAATEVDGGIKNFEQAQAATGANKSTWVKTYNLAKAGFTAKQCVKYALTDKEKAKLSNEKGYLDKDKLAAYIDNMNISRREKWARYEVNRLGYTWFKNPFSF